uniref:Putative immunodominant antigen n=1 Tax=Trypanosoma congolense (strain IL3000) TaxID=1068625 RepID=G0UQ41_TRYCI|nr:putative immunodominant antigen [Trypanosoma congolense IL3000]
MTVVVDLFRDAQHRSSEGHVYSTDVARFTEASEGSRVLADSQCYITYSTKKGDTLRVVQRSDLAKGSMRGHTSAIHAVRFVNYRSNVAASASCGEFFVWLVTSGADGSNGMPQAEPSLAINIYFRLVERVTVRCFSFFINAENKRPDVLLLYENEAAILQSSALIARYSNTPLMATLRENSKTLRPIQAGVTKDALCSVGSGGWFAFTVEPTMIVACTLQNRSTPPWSCCGGAPVRGLHLLDTPQVEGTTTLVACCDRVVYQWSLSGVSEPTLARKFVVDGSVVALESSRGSFAVFNCKQGVAVVQVQSMEKFACSWYALPWQISRGGVSFNRVGEDYYLLADCKDRITITQLKKADSGKKEDCALQQEREQSSPSGVKGVKTGTTPGGTATSIKIKSDPSKPTVGSLIASLANHLGIRPDVGADGTPPASETLSPAATVNAASAAGSTNTAQRGGSYGHSGGRPVTAGLGSAGSTRLPAPASSIAANEPTGGSGGGLRTAIGDEKETAFTGWGSGNPSAAASASVSAPAQSARLALHNASLPQAPTDGVLAAVVQQAQEDVQQELGRLESAMENTLKVLELAPETIQRAHEQLLNLSLEAQMTELQQQDSSGSANYSSFESNVLTSFGDPLAKGIADSVTRGVDDALNAYLEYSVRQALVNCARGTQKHAVKARLDEALKGKHCAVCCSGGTDCA